MPNMAMTKLDTKPRTCVDMHQMQITVNPLNGSHYKPRQAENLTCLDNPRNVLKNKMHGHAWTMPSLCQAHAKPMPSGCAKTCPMSNVAMIPNGCYNDRPHNILRSQILPHIIQHTCNMLKIAMAKLDTHGQA